MNISSISSALNNSYVATSSTNDTSSLEKQKASLNSELLKEQTSKDDEKTKSAKVAAIQVEIQNIDAQIQEKKSGKTSQVSNKQAEPTQNTNSSSNKNNINAEKSSEDSNNIIDTYA